MGEAIAVDGSGSPPSAQIIFSAIDEEKEGDCALPPEEGEGLQDAAAGRPGEPPLPLHKPLKIYPTISDLRRLLHLRLHLPGPKNSPVYIQSLPEHCLRLKKIKKKIYKEVKYSLHFKRNKLKKHFEQTIRIKNKPAKCLIRADLQYSLRIQAKELFD